MENLNNKTSVVSLPHPLTCIGRAIHNEGFLERETLGQYVQRVHVNVPAQGRVLLNGYPIPEHLWKGVRPRTGDTIIFQAIVEGGGGGGSKILRSVAMIAVAILSVYTGGLAAAAFGGSTTISGAIAGGLASAATTMVGGLLVNALLPPPRVGDAAVSSIESKSQAEQYQISGGDNPIRLYESMPLAFGKIKVAPDFSMKPYTELVNQDQYLYQAFNFGLQPDLILEDFKIGTNSITDYQEVNLMIGDANGKLPIAGNVDTQEGFEVLQGDGWIVRTTSSDTQQIQIDFVAQAYKINTQTGATIPQDVALEVEIRPVGTDTWYPCGDAVYYQTGTTSTHYWSYGHWAVTMSPDHPTTGAEGNSGGFGGGFSGGDSAI